ncbi:hypothetical protein D5086_032574 [Populus alba]|uniref:Uncharacterized protein n=1 Tax=Populus alba TaxID=43335 RepID=A0ACC4ALQ6_POPAL
MWLSHQKESIVSFDYKNDVIICLLVLQLGEVELQLEGSLDMRMQAATATRTWYFPSTKLQLQRKPSRNSLTPEDEPPDL